MNTRLAAAAALALGLALSPIARADDKDKSSDTTIHGIVAGVTVEGEMVVDYKTKKAVEVDAAFLTVVGMPGHHREGEARERAAGESAEKGHHRANVYQVWLTPRTKIYCASDDSGNASEKKECGLDKLQVGDRVEVKFARRDDSTNATAASPTERMKGTHGRHRIYSVDAQEITILPAMHQASGSSGSKDSK